MSVNESHNKPRILCVDDETIILEFMSELLMGSYEVRGVASGKACLELVKEWVPDLVLLDVVMPEMSGLDVCRQLKRAETSSLPVIFVSAAASEKERLAGFEAGGQDYIAKPFNEEELLIKVRNTLDTRKRIDALEMGTVASRKQASEMHIALQFMSESFSPSTPQEMADLLLSSVASLGLEANLNISSKQGEEYFSLAGEVGPLERSVFEYVNSHDDLAVTGARTLVQQDNIRLLVTNMPTDDPARNGRLKGHLNMMCGGARSRIRALDIELGLEQQRKVLSAVMQSSHQALIELVKRHQLREEEGKRVMDDLCLDVQHAYLSLGMEMDQEEALNQKLNASRNKLAQLFHDAEELDDLFSTLMDDIQDGLDGQTT